MSLQVAEKTWEIAAPILENEGLELIDVEYVREGGRWVLRLYIDRPGATKESGVGLADCTKASQAVETALDVAELVPHEYALEVSSPGINRPLTRPEHFKKFLGAKVKVKTFAPIGEPPRKNFTGILKSYEAEVAVVEVEGAGSFRIPRKEIAKANLEVDW